jgi:hypothetical protein
MPTACSRAAPAAAAILLALSGCAATTAARMTPPPTVKPPAGRPFETTGSVSFGSEGVGTRVAYGPWGVRGPGIDVSYAGQGDWVGRLGDAEVRFDTADGVVSGPWGVLEVQRRGAQLLVRGQWSRRKVDLTVGQDRLRGGVDGGACTFDLGPAEAGTPPEPGVLTGTLGCSGAPGGGPPTSSQGMLRLGGEAVLLPEVLLPQFVLALLAALPI